MDVFDIAAINPFTLPFVPLAERERLPLVPGIYFAIGSDDAILYIGRARKLANRWLSTSHHRYAELSAMPDVRISWLTIEDESLLGHVENACIEYFRPVLNGKRKVRPVISVPVRSTEHGKVAYSMLFYRLSELTRFLPIAERTLRNFAETGVLPGAVRFGNLWFVDREKLEAHIGRRLPDPR